MWPLGFEVEGFDSTQENLQVPQYWSFEHRPFFTKKILAHSYLHI
jgi:hypothetical protein